MRIRYYRFKWFVGDTIIGIRNVIRWIPVVWYDQDFDWSFLSRIMEYKLRRMSKCIGKGGFEGSKKCGRQMLICAEILKRLDEDKMGKPHRVNIVENNKTYLQRYLGTIIGKYLRHWWD